jgi:hypothetical protein
MTYMLGEMCCMDQTQKVSGSKMNNINCSFLKSSMYFFCQLSSEADTVTKA